MSSIAQRILFKTTFPRQLADVYLKRCYAKAYPRTPIRVLTKDGEDITPRKVPKPKDKPLTLTHLVSEEIEQTGTLPNSLRYRKLRDEDKQFKNLYNAVQIKLHREKKHVTVLEGKTLIQDAIKAGAQIRGLYFTFSEHLEGIQTDSLSGKLFKISQRQLSIVTGLASSPGIVALCETPKNGASLEVAEEDLLPITLVCDQIRDPGNMGTLIRTAAAVGCKKILVTVGSVDIWDPKVIRAGAGSHFQTTILHKLPWHSIGNYIAPGSSVNLAETLCSRALSRFESDSVSDSLGQDGSPGDETLVEKHVPSSYESLPISDIFQTDFSRASEIVLVVGNESRGLSKAAFDLAAQRNGSRIYLPIKPGIDSLNAAMAATAILFEMKRQLYRRL